MQVQRFAVDNAHGMLVLDLSSRKAEPIMLRV